MLRISRARLIAGVIGIVALTASATGVAVAMTAGRPTPASPAVSPRYSGVVGAPATASGYAAPAARTTSAGSASAITAYPQWCCSNGNPLGLTTTGQASVAGGGETARNRAIARAVTDAESQARTAAAAAGVSLGKIIDMQVSVPYYPYPVPMEGAARAGSTSGSPAQPPSGTSGSGGSGAYCGGNVGCPVYPVSTTATVTITWAIG